MKQFENQLPIIIDHHYCPSDSESTDLHRSMTAAVLPTKLDSMAINLGGRSELGEGFPSEVVLGEGSLGQEFGDHWGGRSLAITGMAVHFKILRSLTAVIIS